MKNISMEKREVIWRIEKERNMMGTEGESVRERRREREKS
jgi:hypothetical protein